MINWKDTVTSFGSGGEEGYAGKYKLFNISWNAFTKSDKSWLLNTSLPGLKSRLGSFDYKEEAKSYADKVLHIWMKNTDLINYMNIKTNRKEG